MFSHAWDRSDVKTTRFKGRRIRSYLFPRGNCLSCVRPFCWRLDVSDSCTGNQTSDNWEKCEERKPRRRRDVTPTACRHAACYGRFIEKLSHVTVQQNSLFLILNLDDRTDWVGPGEPGNTDLDVFWTRLFHGPRPACDCKERQQATKTRKVMEQPCSAVFSASWLVDCVDRHVRGDSPGHLGQL